MASPVLDNVEVIQRDTLSSYLVDVSFDVVDADGDDQTLTVEWALDATGPWSVATPQTYDRKHDAINPLSGIPIAAPGQAFNFVWVAFFDLGDGSFTNVHVRVTVQDPSLATDQVVVGPLSISTTVPESTDETFIKAQARRAEVARTPLDFLGRGLLIPFRRGSRDFVSGGGVELVRSAVKQILGTQAAVGRQYPGELKWRPEFGSKLWILKHRNNDSTLRGQAVAFVEEAFLQEPRAQLLEVEIERDSEPNELVIRAKYQIISENVEGNQVFLPVEEEVVKIEL